MRASDRAYERLRDEILDGKLLPDTVLAEVEQSTRLGVSRTPVREAFTRLTADGLVVPRSARVLVVAEISAERIREIYELRQALEATAAAIAARRRDPAPFTELRARLAQAPGQIDAGQAGIARYFEIVDALDEAIERAVANPYFTAALASARLHASRIRRLSRHDPQRLRQAAEEHGLVVEAIIAGDAALASHATHVHLHRSLASALDRITDAERSGAGTPLPREREVTRERATGAERADGERADTRRVAAERADAEPAGAEPAEADRVPAPAPEPRAGREPAAGSARTAAGAGRRTRRAEQRAQPARTT